MAPKKDCCEPLKPEEIKLLQQAEGVMELAQHVSGPDGDVPAGWKILASSAPDEANTAGFFARIYERTGPVAAGESRYMIAFRGTDKFSDKRDIAADVEIGLRILPRQYWEALSFVQKTCTEKGLNPAEIELTGDSLGGYLARTVGAAVGVKKVWAFNSPGPTRKIKSYVENLYPGVSGPLGDRLIQVRSSQDLISRWSFNEGRIFDVKTVGSPHSLTSLRQGIDAAIKGQALPKPAKAKGHSFSLSAIYNRVSGRMSRSRIVNGFIRRAVGQTKGTAQLRQVC